MAKSSSSSAAAVIEPTPRDAGSVRAAVRQQMGERDTAEAGYKADAAQRLRVVLVGLIDGNGGLEDGARAVDDLQSAAGYTADQVDRMVLDLSDIRGCAKFAKTGADENERAGEMRKQQA